MHSPGIELLFSYNYESDVSGNSFTGVGTQHIVEQTYYNCVHGISQSVGCLLHITHSILALSHALKSSEFWSSLAEIVTQLPQCQSEGFD